MLRQALSIALETLINKALSLDIDGRQSLDKLAQQRLNISIAEFGFTLSFTVNKQDVLVAALSEDAGSAQVRRIAEDPVYASCSIDTSLQTLMLLKKQPLTQLIKQHQLDINGDINVAQQFMAVAQDLKIDWETELASHLGDFATYKLSRAGKNLRNKLTFASDQIQADVGEWLVHEQGLLLTRHQVKQFNQEVDDLVKASDSLHARVARLYRQLSSSSEISAEPDSEC